MNKVKERLPTNHPLNANYMAPPPEDLEDIENEQPSSPTKRP